MFYVLAAARLNGIDSVQLSLSWGNDLQKMEKKKEIK